MSVELAEQAFRMGDLNAAARISDDILVAEPGHAGALRVKGMTLVARGKHAEAVQFFRQALEGRPDDFLTLEWLHGALMQTGAFDEAAAVGERALRLRPLELNLLISLSQACAKIGEHGRTVTHLESARSIASQNAVVRRLLGQAYEKAKRNRDALTEYREAIRLNPALKDAYDRANRILLEEGRFAAALNLALQAISVNPEYGQAHLQAAQALHHLGRPEEANEHALRASELDPTLAAHVATWFQSNGKLDEARHILEKSIALRPVQGRAYYGLVKSRRMTEEDRSLLSQMEAVLYGPGLPLSERYSLLKALGKAADDLGEFETAMARFDEAAQAGMAAFNAEHAFDPRRLDAARESFLRWFDRAFMEHHAGLGRKGASPIFVIGMIRSGTTLVQQILTSHRQIGDAGEQPFWTTQFPSVVDLDAGDLRPDAFLEARDHYLEVLRRFDNSSPAVSNKWPMNYAHAGLLKLAYPDAKIIHIERSPLDTVLSIYMTDLGEPPPEFSHRKKHIVAVYRDYRRRMSHWQTTMPEGSIFTVHYEDLVAEQEAWTRKMIEFCGLDWDDGCLSFYKGARRINTPSMLQARQPIYNTSIEKWRNYEPWLGEFSELR